MDLVNADYGYDSVPAQAERRAWYRWPAFPLVPMWDYRKGDKWNTDAWSFSWLFFRYWSLDHIELKIDIGFDVTMLGGSAFRIGAILPYTRLIFSIPLPLGWLDRFRRRPEGDPR
jgi:hypothetical protein